MFLGVTSRPPVASVELSEFVNGESFVGRELARRVTLGVLVLEVIVVVRFCCDEELGTKEDVVLTVLRLGKLESNASGFNA